MQNKQISNKIEILVNYLPLFFVKLKAQKVVFSQKMQYSLWTRGIRSNLANTGIPDFPGL